MWDLIQLLVFLFALALVTVVPVLALIAFQRTSVLERRLKALSNQLTDLRRKQGRASKEVEEGPESTAKDEPRWRAMETVQGLAETNKPSAADKSHPEPAFSEPSAGEASNEESEASTAASKAFSEPVFLRTPAGKAAREKKAALTAEPVEPKPAVNWEWILGVRGAAVLGGIVMALAAVLFFRHAFVHDWITPALRIAMGAAAGLLLIGVGAWLRKSAYKWVPSALQGAGVVALYATVFSAFYYYQYLSWISALPLMALITAAAVALALVNESLLIAQLGLIGGFLTPLLLNMSGDHPLSTFTFIMLLNLGLLAAGKRRKWNSLGNVAIVATFLFESHWILGDMLSYGPGGVWIGLGAATLFGILFLGAALTREQGDKDAQLAEIPFQIAAALCPLFFGAYFATQVSMGGKLWPLLVLLIPASFGTLIVGASRNFRGLSVGGVLAPVGIVASWFLSEQRTSGSDAWQVFAVSALIGVSVAVFAEWGSQGGLLRLFKRLRLPEPRETDAALFEVVAASSSAAWLISLVVFASLWSVESEPLMLPRLAGLVLFAALLFRHGVQFSNGPLLPLGSIGLSLGFLGLHFATWGSSSRGDHEIWGALGMVVAFVAAYFWAGHTSKRSWSPWAIWAASGFVAVQASGLLLGGFDLAQFPWAPFAAIPVLLGFQLAASVKLKSQLLYALALVGTLWMELLWTSRLGTSFHATHPWMCLPQLAIVVALGGIPIVFPERLGQHMLLRRVAALVPLLMAPIVGASLSKWDGVWNGSISFWILTWIALMGAAWQLHRDPSARRRAPKTTPPRSGIAWSSWTAALLLASAATMAIDTDRTLLVYTLLGLFWAAGSHYLQHRGLAWWSVVGVVSAGLTGFARAIQKTEFLANSSFLWHEFSGLYLSLVAVSVAMFFLLRDAPRFKELPRPASLAAAIGGVSLFLWMNLEIANHFAEGLYTGPFLVLSGETLPARDVTTSVAWGVFAIGLLSLGSFGRDEAARAKAPRWASLGLFALAIGKVFLFDLRHLEGLWRVASLVGLALALITLSLFYQRFVFRKPSVPATP